MLSINGTRESNKKDISVTPPMGLFEREIFVNCGTSMIDRLQNAGQPCKMKLFMINYFLLGRYFFTKEIYSTLVSYLLCKYFYFSNTNIYSCANIKNVFSILSQYSVALQLYCSFYNNFFKFKSCINKFLHRIHSQW